MLPEEVVRLGRANLALNNVLRALGPFVARNSSYINSGTGVVRDFRLAHRSCGSGVQDVISFSTAGRRTEHQHLSCSKLTTPQSSAEAIEHS